MSSTATPSNANSIIGLSAAACPEFAKFTKAQRDLWTTMLLDYVFKVRSYSQIVAAARKELPRFDIKAAWRSCTESGYVLRNVKTWLYYCVRNDMSSRAANEVSSSFEIVPADRVFRALMSQRLLSRLKALALKYPCLTLKGMDRAIVQVYVSMQEWLGKFVYRKMRFVYQQQGLQAYDMEMEVFARGIHALLMTYPIVETRLHATNIAKAAAHNFGINMIVRQTHECRAAWVKGKDGTTSSRVVPISQIVEGSEFELPLEAIDTREQLELRYDVLQTCAQEVTTARQERFVALLLGKPDTGFDTWLLQTHRIRSGADAYQEKVTPERFITLAAQYLGFEKGAAKLVTRLQRRLRAYAPGTPRSIPTSEGSSTSSTSRRKS